MILNSAQVGLILSFAGGLGDILLSTTAVFGTMPIAVLCAWIILSSGLRRPEAIRR
ncbi:MAG TPA: hypothetical protein VFF30_13180 [Nitrososphaerales archaeon]|nr:hypothetical protein [Nitrososphaerales archaeon]